MSKKQTSDKCTKDMMSHSAVCSFYPKSKITKCLKEASNIHTECVKGTPSGVSSGDTHSNNFPSSSRSSVAKHHSGSYTASNGDKYNNGKLTSFVSPTSGLRMTVRRPGPRG